MPVLRNTKHEIFARAIAAGKTGEEAQKEAGYRPDSGSACRLKQRLEPRIQELSEKATDRAVRKVEVTVASLLAKLEDVYHLANRVDSPSSAVQALMAQARLAGLVTDKQQVTIESATSESDVARWMLDKLAVIDEKAPEPERIEVIEQSGPEVPDEGHEHMH